jgi:hypothetical protein
MGHDRLGTLPDTARWRHVVQLIAEEADVGRVAQATTEAAVDGLEKARHDEGLAFTVWLLTRISLAGGKGDFAAALRDEGVPVPNEPGVFDIIAGVTQAIDQHLHKTRGRTDIGEMAEMAAVEALTALLGQRTANLYGATPAEVQSALMQFSTQKGFSELTHEVFCRFSQRFLTYHLGRELSQHVGGNGRFSDPADHSGFVDQLAIHCRQATAIMRDYAGDWYSKQNFLGGISPAKAKRFTEHAVKKLQDELAIRGKRDG